MNVKVPTLSPAGLRRELNQRSRAMAGAQGLLHALSDGEPPSVIFGCDEEGRHGNFHPRSYRHICGSLQWAGRLNKAHTATRRMWVRSDWPWRELDCACSSDALLMSIFCYPGVTGRAALCGLLGIAPGHQPVFGYKPRVPLVNGKLDQTEVDMALGALLVEAKLTESDFQKASVRKLLRYRDLESVFTWPGGMPNDDHAYGALNGAPADAVDDIEDGPHQPSENVRQIPASCGRAYQVMRGVLAAHASGGAFLLLCDARRQDLVEHWFAVLSTVREAALRSRIKLLTWQELCAVLPRELQQFLECKYGIVPAC